MKRHGCLSRSLRLKPAGIGVGRLRRASPRLTPLAIGQLVRKERDIVEAAPAERGLALVDYADHVVLSEERYGWLMDHAVAGGAGREGIAAAWELLLACEADCSTDDIANGTIDESDADDAPVGHSLGEGRAPPMPTYLRFGHMRRLRKALLALTARPASPGPQALERVRDVKRGIEYEVLGEAYLRMAYAPVFEGSRLETRGAAWRKRRFHEVWSETFTAARIAEDLHFHDLRGTAVTMLAEAGCTVPEIATITGHSQSHAQKILDQYLARTRELAESAIAKLDDHRRNRAVLQTVVQTA